MENIRKQKIRDYLTEALKHQGDKQPLADNHSVFVSGRLDSVSMMMMVVLVLLLPHTLKRLVSQLKIRKWKPG
jgi:hypothetical protein